MKIDRKCQGLLSPGIGKRYATDRDLKELAKIETQLIQDTPLPTNKQLSYRLIAGVPAELVWQQSLLELRSESKRLALVADYLAELIEAFESAPDKRRAPIEGLPAFLARLFQCKCQDRAARCNLYILLSIQSVADRRRHNRAAGLKLLQHLAGAVIEGDQISLAVACKNQPSGGRKNSGARRTDHIEPPLGFGGDGIHSENCAGAVRVWRTLDIAGLIPLSFREFLCRFVKQLAILARGEIVQTGSRAVGGGLPVMASAYTRTRELSFFGRLLVFNKDGAAICADSLRPTHLGVWPGLEHLAIRSIERVKESVAIGLHQRFDFAPFDREIRQDGIADSVPVVHVMRSELVIPFQFSGISIECNDTAGEKIIAATDIAIHVWPGVTSTPVNQVEFGIICSSDPG